MSVILQRLGLGGVVRNKTISSINKAFRKPNTIYAIAMLVMAAVYSGFLCTKGLPLSEGWYTEYAWRINHGDVPYRDFSLLFPSLYAYLISFITSLFGYDLIVLRIFGVIVFCLEALAILNIFRLLFAEPYCFAAAVLAVLFEHAGVVDIIFYDYLYVMNLYVYVYIYLCISLLVKSFSPTRKAAYETLAGFFLGLIVISKQSTGIMLLAFSLIYIIVYRIIQKQSKIPVFEICGFVFPIALFLVWLAATNSLGEFYKACFVNAVAAKGGLFSELFAWIINGRYYIPFGFCFALPLFLFSTQRTGASNAGKWLAGKMHFVVAILFSMSFLLLLFLLYIKSGFADSASRMLDDNLILFFVFGFTTLVFVASVINVIRMQRSTECRANVDDLAFIFLFGCEFVISWACGMSAGLALDQSALAFGAMLCLVYRSHGSGSIKSIVSFAAIFLLVSTVCVSKKYVQLYNWWGLSTGNVWEQTERSNVPLLNGITMSKSQKDAYDGIYDIARLEGLSDKDLVFVGPHCPILYSVVGSHSKARSVVQWFDVSSDDDISEAIEWIHDERPRMIIYCDLPEGTLAGHEKAFGRYQTRRLQTYVDSLIDNDYREKAVYDVGGGYLVKVLFVQ